MNDPRSPELVPSPLKICLTAIALALVAFGIRTIVDGAPLRGVLIGYGGILLVFGCYAHGNGERNRIRAMHARNRR